MENRIPVNRFTKNQAHAEHAGSTHKNHEWKLFFAKGVQAGNTLVDEQKQAGVGNGRKKYVRKFPAMVKWMAEGMLVSRHAARSPAVFTRWRKRTASSSAREKSEKCKSARCRAEGRSFHYERDRIRGGKACFHPQFHSKKILTLSAVIVLPFLVLSAVLLVSMSGYRRSYEEIVRNIAVANDYNLNFKEEMDESLYKLVVGYIDYEHIGDDPSLQDPYQMIGELKTEFTKLRDVTTGRRAGGGWKVFCVTLTPWKSGWMIFF